MLIRTVLLYFNLQTKLCLSSRAIKYSCWHIVIMKIEHDIIKNVKFAGTARTSSIHFGHAIGT